MFNIQRSGDGVVFELRLRLQHIRSVRRYDEAAVKECLSSVWNLRHSLALARNHSRRCRFYRSSLCLSHQ